MQISLSRFLALSLSLCVCGMDAPSQAWPAEDGHPQQQQRWEVTMLQITDAHGGGEEGAAGGAFRRVIERLRCRRSLTLRDLGLGRVGFFVVLRDRESGLQHLCRADDDLLSVVAAAPHKPTIP